MFQPKPHRRAFSLIEVLVVLGIISLLAGITVRVVRSVAATSERQRTESTLELLRTATVAWETEADRKLTWWHPGDSAIGDSIYSMADVHADTGEVFIITEILTRLEAVQTSRDILARIDPDDLYEYESGEYPDWISGPFDEQELEERFVGAITALDAWGTPIYATHPGRTWRESDGPYPPKNRDGTVLTYNEWKYGIAGQRQIVYVSAGPDKLFGLPEEFGDLSGDALADAVREARRDNLFSSPVEFFMFN